MTSDHKISLALTHFNRFEMLIECVQGIASDSRIGEIVISDDASTDGSWEKLVARFADYPKVKLYRNEKNLDCYANKAQAVKRTTNGWLILFDSDNVLTSAYLDALYHLSEWDVNTIYCPDFAEPNFDYTAFGGMTIDARNVSIMMGRETRGISFDRRKMIGARRMLAPLHSRFRTALNTCNFFVHRDEYLSVWDGSVDPHTSDTIYQNFNWIKSGKKLFIVKGLRYFHRVHDKSHFKLNQKKTGDFASKVEAALIALR